MSRALTSLPAVNPTSVERRAQYQCQLRLGNAPLRVTSNSDRLPRTDDPAGSRLEEEFRPVCSVDQVVKSGCLV